MNQNRTSGSTIESIKPFLAAGVVLASTANATAADEFDAAPLDQSRLVTDIEDKTSKQTFSALVFYEEMRGMSASSVEDIYDGFVDEIDELYGFELVAKGDLTDIFDAVDVGPVLMNLDDPQIAEARSIIRGFEELSAGWDGAGSVGPKPDVIEDALTVIQNWRGDLPTPEPVMGFDGNLLLEFYDDNGFTLGGLEFIGDHFAIYNVIDRTELITSGRFDTESQIDILRSIEKIRRALT